jgi:transposase
VLPKAKKGRTGRPPKYARREIWNAIFYQARTGCEWRYLPHDLPPWEDVWEHFSRWREDGTLQQVHTALREKVRQQAGREPTPSAAIIDSQSVKTAQKGGPTVSTTARRSKDASVTLRWIHWVLSLPWSCIARASPTVTGPNSSS